MAININLRMALRNELKAEQLNGDAITISEFGCFFSEIHTDIVSLHEKSEVAPIIITKWELLYVCKMLGYKYLISQIN